MIADPQAPWMFRRDEVDLLEEDIDDLYDLHQSADGRIHSVEHAIISEQLDTEEQADAELTMQMDVKWLTRLHAQKPSWESDRERLRDEDDLTCDVSRPPFYEQLFRFADQVFVYVSDVYARQDEIKEHAFRVQVNIKMVPIKCANALSEEQHDDPLSLMIAKKEFALAIIYLERILLSLAFRAAAHEGRAQEFLAPGTQFKQRLQQHLARLLSDRRGIGTDYE